MTDFFSSDAGQCASMAKQFLEGALVLNAAQRVNGRVLFIPTLALAGHGLELMLKASCYLNGHPPPTRGRQGHNIVYLWSTDACEPVRGHLFLNALKVASEARTSGEYLDVPKEDDVLPLIEEYIIELGKLHGGTGGYPLRYPSGYDQKAPRTPFLVESLRATADDFLKRPSDFELRSFHGQG